MNPARRAGTLLLAFLRRDWLVATSYKLAFVTGIGGTLVTLFFLYFLGRLIGGTPGIHLGGAAMQQGYFPFAVLGVSLLGIVSTELNAVSAQIRSDQTTGTLEALLSMPPPPWFTMMGSVAFQLAFAAVSALVAVVLAVIGFGMRFHTDLAGVAVSIVGLGVSLFVFMALGVAFASAVIIFKRGGQLSGVTATAFSLLGGVYYPTSILGRWHYLSDLLPFTWALNLLRGALLERRLLWGQLGLLVAATVVLVPLSFQVFNVAVTRSRRAGTLGQY